LEDAAVSAQAEKIYQELQHAGFTVLFDDRLARAGEKFSDADLIGIPARLTVSKRTLEQGKVEFKLRRDPKAELLTLEEAQNRIKAGQKVQT
jgi:prolyl-tRNA synthetase